LTFSVTVYNLGQFWTKIKNETIIVGMHAVKALLLFVTNCLCEFSVLAQIKTKTRNCLEPEDDMRLALPANNCSL